ncbi:Protein of unknown function DUF3537 [Dillenia turbinata]|uniref:Uncharacterized protein n=1 Tax=Dillenia turbinata TaxID=194707 RepID=A0AAN8Z7H0_9MAGN
MKTSSIQTTGDTCVDLEFFDQHISFNDQTNEQHHASLPLLLQPSYARSKSSVFDELRKFRISLKWCALDHSSCVGKFISYLTFITLTVAVPLTASLSIKEPSTSTISFNKLVELPESSMVIISFFTLWQSFRAYGLRQLLFLDGLQDDSMYVRRGYAKELDKAFRYLACILLPTFLFELAHKIIFFSTVDVQIPRACSRIPINSIMFFSVLASWIYRTGVFLLVCVLFRLTCELQILRFEGFRKMLEGSGSDARVIFEEHLRIRKQLSLTSHRYRFFIIGSLIIITISQFGALLMVLASKSEKNFLNSGDLVVCSAVQLSGFFLCLMGAARITHRAQGIVSVATRWHMFVTCSSSNAGLDDGREVSTKADHDANQNQVAIEGAESDSDIFIPVSSQDSSSFQTRQALVTYLQHNNGGITLFGFAFDRGLLHTIFAFEFSLVLWILSQVVVLS